jgi:hypothetical protein
MTMTTTLRILYLIGVIACTFATTACAQHPFPTAEMGIKGLPAFSGYAALTEDASPGIVQNAAVLDLDGLEDDGWTTLVRTTRGGLWSRNPMNRMQGLQNLLLISALHPQKADFSGETARLCRLARYDRQPGLRIMAVAALRAVDTPEAMGCLVDQLHDPWQPERLAVITRGAVAEYMAAGVKPVH